MAAGTGLLTPCAQRNAAGVDLVVCLDGDDERHGCRQNGCPERKHGVGRKSKQLLLGANVCTTSELTLHNIRSVLHNVGWGSGKQYREAGAEVDRALSLFEGCFPCLGVRLHLWEGAERGSANDSSTNVDT